MGEGRQHLGWGWVFWSKGEADGRCQALLTEEIRTGDTY
jgi:hypothetical protein